MAKWDAVIVMKHPVTGRLKAFTKRGFASRDSAETFARNCVRTEPVTKVLLSNVHISE